ncbi:MAG: aminodeoxychorismate/anthranilate synthase component II [Planctomycetota bacterium]|nr:MAG: aminodeoxychorismate/anthranilate synthase component II [Planctomycetota bacterium]
MNLVQPLRAWGCAVEVVRNDAWTVDAALAWRPERIVLSPGPGGPPEAGICVELVRAAAARGIPLLGVCLGHQCLAAAFGGRVREARRPLHGRASLVRHDGRGIFRGLPSPLRAARYHSLAVDPAALPACLEPSAWAEDGTLMALRHRRRPLVGLQFHPESYLSPEGEALLRNFAYTPPSDRSERTRA